MASDQGRQLDRAVPRDQSYDGAVREVAFAGKVGGDLHEGTGHLRGDAGRAVDPALQQVGCFEFSNHARIVGRSVRTGKGDGRGAPKKAKKQAGNARAGVKRAACHAASGDKKGSRGCLFKMCPR